MDNVHHDLNILMKKEADSILLDKDLLTILKSFGTPHIHGSYFLDLMTWRDLDIYLESENISTTDFFKLGEKICSSFDPVKMSFRNELKAKTKGLPNGLYWGIYLGDERAGAWKIDIWAVSPKECQRLLDYCNTVKRKLYPEAVRIIMEIKSQCWQDPAFRKSYSSSDIYAAVLDKNISSLGEFKEHLNSLT